MKPRFRYARWRFKGYFGLLANEQGYYYVSLETEDGSYFSHYLRGKNEKWEFGQIEKLVEEAENDYEKNA